ncbi:aldo/keto reductase [Compostimonas suwonensis]|uniref:Aryl-alcohol dehydrogenase-like predicted oxidoreductase n=1 Tax=Compostimonas suwonensis TaxID=1048394 RepID=A0A2M9BTU3_9MICO|nr:aldo/keto reductase [Compostimonas suwonensis]PJJ61360.1 aryl-alcohol dehydrogenase-like predicted oxidoreductase [Compostimonas suwonensis]
MSQLAPVLAQHHVNAPQLVDSEDSRPGTTQPLAIVAPRRLGTDLTVYPLALGGSVFGWTADAAATTRILDRYRSHGGNFIDTADNYASGRSEALIGAWMEARGNRDAMVVATKVGRNLDNPGLRPKAIRRAVDASLERLRTDHIDVLYFHYDDQEVPLEDSLGAAGRLIESGKVRHLAASNFSAERLIEARVLAATGLPTFIALQTNYSLMHRREVESGLSLVASAQGMGILPYFALANGFLTGKYRSKADLTASTRGVRAGEYLGRRGSRVLSALDDIAAVHNTSVATIALAWILAKPAMVAPVASASRPEQVDALMAAAGIRLTRSQVIELDRVSA